MQVGLKIWRYDSSTGDRALKEYEIEAPEWATLLDCLDIVKDQHDGSLAFRKSCRMMICGSCGMRMDGAAVLACKTRMYDIAQAGHVPVISAMGNLPIRKDLVVDMDPFWSKFKAMWPWLEPGYERPEDGREYRVSQERMNVIHKESLCINCGCCVSECNAMESDPEFLGPQALAKGMRFVGDPRDCGERRAARAVQLRARHLGLHSLLLLQRALPEGRRPARRDREARRRVDPPRHRPRHGREAREVVRPLRGDDGLAARGGADPEDAGLRLGDQAAQVRRQPRAPRQGAPGSDPAHGEGRERGAQPAQARPRAGPAGRARPRAGRARAREARPRVPAASRSRRSTTGRAPRRGRGYPKWRRKRKREHHRDTAEASRVLQGLPRVALREGARQLDEGARAHASGSSSWSSSR